MNDNHNLQSDLLLSFLEEAIANTLNRYNHPTYTCPVEELAILAGTARDLIEARATLSPSPKPVSPRGRKPKAVPIKDEPEPTALENVYQKLSPEDIAAFKEAILTQMRSEGLSVPKSQPRSQPQPAVSTYTWSSPAGKIPFEMAGKDAYGTLPPVRGGQQQQARYAEQYPEQEGYLVGSQGEADLQDYWENQ